MNAIAQLRAERGWSQEDLAEKLNTTAVSVGRYEKQDQRLTLPLMRRVAKVFRVSVAQVAGEASSTPLDHTGVPVYDVRAAAGAGAFLVDEQSEPSHYLMFREQWLRRVSRDISQLIVLEVSGDSMWDTLHDGDHALVDRSQLNPRREGLYVLRIDDVLQVKRLSMHPVSKLLTIKSDNANYPTYSDINPDDIALVGRVVWIGRALG
ncbi:MAG TPA: S24 family peptidase [Rhizomicrobium sp.]|jgi:phage repressor protein C with HTH and peptisase S24 domain|nr:S24 family peptidase [Rhizomicrobium sp.]